MRQAPKPELASIFFREIDGYIPKLDLGISTLRLSTNDRETIGEVYRYFHNIKGAASQVDHNGLSKSAGICEALLGDLIENNKSLDTHHLNFLSQVTLNIGEFCKLSEKSPAAEQSLYTNTVSFFKSLMHQLGPQNPVIISSELIDMLPDMDVQNRTTPSPTVKDNLHDLQSTEFKSHLDCLLSLRSVIPLLKELAEYSPENGSFKATALPPMTKAVKTLASLTSSAGLKGHHALLSQFLIILIRLEQSQELPGDSTPALLQEFLLYLDLVFSMPPRDGEEAAQKVQAHLDSLCNLLIQDNVVEESTQAITETVEQSIEDPARLDAETDSPEPEDNPFSSPSSIDDELLLIFQSECEEHIQIIEDNLDQLNNDVTEATAVSESLKNVLANIRRAAHTLKGAAAMTGFDTISKCSKLLEEYLDWLHDNCQTLLVSDISLISQASEAIKQLVGSTGADNHDFSYIETRIENQKNLQRSETIVSQRENDQPEDVADLFSQPDFLGSDAIEQSPEFLLDINEDDILLDISPDNADIDTLLTTPELIAPATTPQAHQIDPELLAIFQSECDEHLQIVASALNTLTRYVTSATPVTAEIRDYLGSVRRAVHTLKGAAAMTGFDQLASCSHNLEDLLDWLHDNARHIEPRDLTIIAQSIDIIESISLYEKASDTIDIDELITSIRDHLQERSHADAAPTHEKPEAGIQPETVVQSAVIQESGNRLPEGAGLPGDSGNIRVKVEDLDELVNIEGELVVVRGSVEKLLDKLSGSLSELNTVKDTLRRKAQELEVGFEAQSLYGFGSGAAPQEPDLAGGTSELSEFDPIELDRYSQLNLIIRSLNEISIDINAIYAEMSALGTGLQGQIAKQQLAMTVMQEKLMRIRMTPLSSISRLLHRTVRQTSARLGKNVQLSITGDDVFMDRFIWSRTIDPFSHILRNCIDHGIEDEVTRKQFGKPPVGQITFNATQRGRFVVLKISDDGRGINTAILRQRLINEDLIPADSTLTDTELLPYVFRPSISTREDVSQTSGRGVGLDVVLKNIQELRGSVQVHNSPSQGVTFELRIPITLSVNRAVIFDLSNRTFAVPIHDIVEVRKFTTADFVDDEKVRWNDKTIPLVNLAKNLQLPKPATESSNILTLVIENADNAFSAVQIDQIEEQREIVVKDLGSHLKYVRGINGVTLTGEGAIIPILNLHELTTTTQKFTKVEIVEEPEVASTEPLKVLVVDDSISVRYSISRLVESQSWHCLQAVDGVDALEKLETATPDVIILDIEMPRMNGFEFMGIIRNDLRYRNLPVFMLTSRASEKHQNKARELGVNHYMIKPFQEEDFIKLLSEFDTDRSQNI